MNKISQSVLIVTMLTIAGGVGYSDAQTLTPTLTPIVGGIPVHCIDATGTPVYTIINFQLGDAGRSSIQSNGMRLIQLNPSVMGSPLMQLFVYAHECGHHMSGDIVVGTFLHHDNPAREENADRIGIRLLRDQFHITLAQATFLADAFINNPAIPPYYLPGPQRALWIVDCYKTNDDSCGGSQADYSVQTAPSDSTMQSASNAPPTDSLCSALTRMARYATHGFYLIRGQQSAFDSTIYKSRYIVPGADSCNIISGDLVCRMPDSTDSSALEDQIEACLRPISWDRDDRDSSYTYFTPPQGSYLDQKNVTISVHEDKHGRVFVNVSE